MLALSDLTLHELELLLRSWGQKPIHASRILRAYYTSGGRIDDAIPSLGKTLPGRIGADLAVMQTRVAREHMSSDGTIKLLVQLGDGQAVESVLMPGFREGRAAGCISSQVGCAMRCDFCASTRDGLTRNLTSGEIVEQFLHLRARAIGLGRRLSSLVFMGMGEPLHNLPNVLPAIERIADPQMGALGTRNIAVSTVGIVPGIEELSRAADPPCLAVSLHAPDDETRRRIVPTTSRWNIDAIMHAAREYYRTTGRIVNVEYCLLAGVNDSQSHATLLAGLMSDFRAHVNLIPYNAIGAGVSGRLYARPTDDQIAQFIGVLRASNVVCHVRTPRGDDVAAACGQLQQQAQITRAGGLLA